MNELTIDQSKEIEIISEKALALAASSTIAMVGSNGDGGFPNIKAMFCLQGDGIKTVYFSTNTSSKRVQQFRENPSACVYFVDNKTFEGLNLTGKMEILSDHDTKQKFWEDGCEVYYPLGVDDPDYTILRFTAISANYYNNLKNYDFIP